MRVSASANGFRPEIQGLRAIAMLFVVGFHVWPSAIPGGYVGVDVFFVISGFLITGLLLREYQETARIDLRTFWVRRIRRLLPAALLVLFTCVALTFLILPKGLWKQTLTEAAASGLYVQNWLLARESASYFAVEYDPTMVQHFWSLSVEEQFYIIWPLALVFALVKSSRNTREHGDGRAGSSTKRVFLTLVLSLFFISLFYSAYVTSTSPGIAYFSTATRAWEFALGALLHALPRSPRNVFRAEWLFAGVAWIGVAGIVVAAVTFSDTTAFPGVAALLPTIGTAIVIWAGRQDEVYSWSRLSEVRVVRLLGDLSYSGYLWHWPLIIAFPLVFGRDHTGWDGILLVIATLLLAWLTKKYVEDPIRYKTPKSGSIRTVFGFAVSGMVVLTVASAVGHQIVQRDHELRFDGGFSYLSVADIKAELRTTLESKSWPEGNQPPGKEALPKEWMVDKCLSISRSGEQFCRYGTPDASRKLVLLGDSWAIHLLPGVRQAFGEDWDIHVVTVGQCPIADVAVHKWSDSYEYSACARHRSSIPTILEQISPDLVIASDSTISALDRLNSSATGDAAFDEVVTGVQKSYRVLSRGKWPIVIVESPPRANCLVTGPTGPADCVTSKATLFEHRLAKKKAVVAADAGLPFLDLTFWVCSSDLICPQQIGGFLVKADTGHFSETFSRKLGSLLRNQIEAIVDM
ncbi:acyltransferase family protein [Ruegeria sp. HKCCA5014]|uniref:acyltransferase family protein n=1 Tax=Ruegeria sp. HKCCA5014 TaxID=2682980 RepID=UPI001488A110|nr:acyltransferase family protein [Ruegeria sp. HKCCA5014]